MKKLIFLLSLLFLAAPIFGDYTLSEYRRQVTQLGSGARYDPIVQIIQSLGSGTSMGTGETFYVDSGVSGGADDGSSWENAFDTLDEAFATATANRGDVIYVAQGHTESGSAAGLFDADVAGVTVIGLGNGTNAPTFTFADTDTTCVLGAANIVLYNLRFAAGISEVVTGISVEAAADDCSILNCVFPEPGTSTFEFDKAIVVAAGADRLLVQDCIQYTADATGATNFIDMDTGVNNGTRIIGNHLEGEYAEGAIHSDDVDLEVYVAYNRVINMTTGQHGIEFTAAATGFAHDNLVGTDTVAASYDLGAMGDAWNYWDDTDTSDTSAIIWTTEETGVNVWGASRLAQIEAEVVDGIEADHLDHLAAVSIADEIVDDSFFADLVSATGDWSTFVKTTDSLEAQRNNSVQSITATTTDVSNDTVLFSVAGGHIKLIEIIGVVTTGIQAQSCLINFNVAATTPAGDTAFATDGTALEINGDAAGTIYTWDGVIANDLTATTSGVALAPGTDVSNGLYIPIGDIELKTTATNTGVIEFTMRYIPMHDAALVTTAL